MASENSFIIAKSSWDAHRKQMEELPGNTRHFLMTQHAVFFLIFFLMSLFSLHHPSPSLLSSTRMIRNEKKINESGARRQNGGHRRFCAEADSSRKGWGGEIGFSSLIRAF